MIRWFSQQSRFMQALELQQPLQDAAEAYAESRKWVPGFCTHCQSEVEFVVDLGTRLGAHPSLREGMGCPMCGLNNRRRLVLDALEESFPRGSGATGALLEATTTLAAAVRARFPNAITSEYFGPNHVPGTEVSHKWKQVRHESISGMSFADDSMHFVVHCDILEHVSDTASALAESARVLTSGGMMVFTMPFFPYREQTQVRGIELPDGSIEHLLPAEFHGDGLRGQGIYTFYHLGWDFFTRLQECGVRTAEIGMACDVFCGYTGNNHRYGREDWMPAIVFRAMK